MYCKWKKERKAETVKEGKKNIFGITKLFIFLLFKTLIFLILYHFIEVALEDSIVLTKFLCLTSQMAFCLRKYYPLQILLLLMLISVLSLSWDNIRSIYNTAALELMLYLPI